VGHRDPRIDTYIAKAAPFAQPILATLRDILHAACPDVEETIKWSRPAFDYHGPMCVMSAFKAHLSLGFWKSAMLPDEGAVRDTLRQLDRVDAGADLPAKQAIVKCVVLAMALNDAGVKPVRAARATTASLAVPPDLEAALAKHATARAAFHGMSPSHQREYCEWIADAKREVTRVTRVEKTIAQLSEGRSLNWKYDSRQNTTRPVAKVSAAARTRGPARGTA
jgi:uncharacterized protein YdeI (YjbR/CyaY-like superfamily)